MRSNRMKASLERGDVVCGAILAFAAPGLVELMGLAGLDYVILDEQHGWSSPEMIADLIRTADNAGLTPLVRVPEIHAPTVGRVLDLGAQGIVFPNVDTADDARRAVASMRYEPYGNRSSCHSVRAADYSLDGWGEHYERSNDDLFSAFLIETRQGFDNLEEILDVEGVDAVVFGPIDLASSLGVPGQMEHPEVVRLIDRAKQLVLDRGIVLCGLRWALGFDFEGARMFWLGSGIQGMVDEMRENAAAVRRRAAGQGVATHLDVSG